jgi:glutathione S-transferase
LDNQLAKEKFLVPGNDSGPSIADIQIAEQILQLRLGGDYALRHVPNVQRWLEEVQAWLSNSSAASFSTVHRFLNEKMIPGFSSSA